MPSPSKKTPNGIILAGTNETIKRKNAGI